MCRHNPKCLQIVGNIKKYDIMKAEAFLFIAFTWLLAFFGFIKTGTEFIFENCSGSCTALVVCALLTLIMTIWVVNIILTPATTQQVEPEKPLEE